LRVVVESCSRGERGSERGRRRRGSERRGSAQDEGSSVRLPAAKVVALERVEVSPATIARDGARVSAALHSPGGACTTKGVDAIGLGVDADASHPHLDMLANGGDGQLLAGGVAEEERGGVGREDGAPAGEEVLEGGDGAEFRARGAVDRDGVSGDSLEVAHADKEASRSDASSGQVCCLVVGEALEGAEHEEEAGLADEFRQSKRAEMREAGEGTGRGQQARRSSHGCGERWWGRDAPHQKSIESPEGRQSERSPGRCKTS
jgi:hypothetical protein